MSRHERAIAEIRSRVQAGEAVLVAGAGVSMATSASSSVASWTGLIKDGLSHCVEFGSPRLSDDKFDLCNSLVESGDVDLLIAAASVIEARLGAPSGAEWNRWIKQALGSIAVENAQLIDAIHRLGVPVVTTNYDDILLKSTLAEKLTPVTWKNPSDMVEVLMRRRPGIVCLHGHWSDPSSVILGWRSYERIVSEDATQEIQRAIGRFKTLIFVGYGAGISDPNFRPLLSWLSRTDSPQHRHYVLLRAEDASAFESTESIYAVAYGPTYEFLPAFLDSITNEQGKSVSSIRRDAVNVIKPFESFVEADTVPIPRMVVIPPGSFKMGCPDDDQEGTSEERPSHNVEIQYSFAVSAFPVTFEEWDSFQERLGSRLRPNDGGWGRGRRPVINVSWNDVHDYLDWLNDLPSVEGSYRLLSEAEWEYVARAGSTDRYWWGHQYVRGNANSDEENNRMTVLVDSYAASPFAIYDMLGNVWEWVEDAFHQSYEGAPLDGSAWIEGNDMRRVVRGGCWYYHARYLRAYARLAIPADTRFNSIGFRIARTIRQAIKSGERCCLISASSGLAATATPDGQVVQRKWIGSPDQVWVITEGVDGDSVIQSVANNRFLSVTEPINQNLSHVIVTSDPSPNLRAWRAEPERDGYVLVFCASEKVLDVENISREEQTPIIQFSRHGNANQRWWVRPASTPVR